MSPVSAKTSKTAVLLIDIQQAFHISDVLGKDRNNPDLEAKVPILLDKTRKWNSEQKSGHQHADIVEIIHVRHHSINPDSSLHPSFTAPRRVTVGDGATETSQQLVRGIDAMDCAREIPGEPIFTKDVNSAFIGTGLESYIKERQIRQLIIFGLTTDHCVSTTTRMAANLKVVNSSDGKEQGNILLVRDLCATFRRGEFPAEVVHNVQLASLNEEFAEVVNLQDILQHVLTS